MNAAEHDKGRDSGQTQRKAAMAVLAHATADEIAGQLAAISLPAHENLREAENGLVMLRGRIGGDGRPFNLGEMTVTRAVVQLLSRNGEVEQTGFGHVAGRSPRCAELVALFDALLQDATRRKILVETVVVPLAAQQQAAKRAQEAKVAATKVNFFTLARGE